jgi:hypothetical protein
MTSIEVTENEIINMIKYISLKIGDLSVEDRHKILKIIIKSGIDDSKIQSKGSGTQVKYKDLSYETIILIHKFTKEAIASKLEQLKLITVENTALLDIQ